MMIFPLNSGCNRDDPNLLNLQNKWQAPEKKKREMEIAPREIWTWIYLPNHQDREIHKKKPQG